MFKEVVSLAIIVSFFLNLAYVPHPNSSSYTFYFVLSLLVISPFVFAWRFWQSIGAEKQSRRGDGLDGPSVSDVLGGDSHGDQGLGADLEKGVVEEVEDAVGVETL